MARYDDEYDWGDGDDDRGVLWAVAMVIVLAFLGLVGLLWIYAGPV